MKNLYVDKNKFSWTILTRNYVQLCTLTVFCSIYVICLIKGNFVDKMYSFVGL